jgi:cell division cycle 14
LVYKKTPEEAYQPLIGLNPPFHPYRDAGYGPATYHITILDCLRGLCQALTLGLFDLQNFDLMQYDFYERVENGDFTWITPKFLALANPKDDNVQGPISNNYGRTDKGNELYSCYKSSALIRWMLSNNVKTIIRLNNKTYDRRPFVEAGIEHIELYFPDGSTPPEPILKRFIEICESRTGKTY